ncbi:MAG: hypothetical protein IJX14_01445 [Clostridia bacterium]|nr:hypothetical protein [Clostridia bacterium]
MLLVGGFPLGIVPAGAFRRDTPNREDMTMKVVIWKSPRLAVPFLRRFFKFGKS